MPPRRPKITSRRPKEPLSGDTEGHERTSNRVRTKTCPAVGHDASISGKLGAPFSSGLLLCRAA
eukprot:2454490-Pyramimonas_sp.AAC.1